MLAMNLLNNALHDAHTYSLHASELQFGKLEILVIYHLICKRNKVSDSQAELRALCLCSDRSWQPLGQKFIWMEVLYETCIQLHFLSFFRFLAEVRLWHPVFRPMVYCQNFLASHILKVPCLAPCPLSLLFPWLKFSILHVKLLLKKVSFIYIWSFSKIPHSSNDDSRFVITYKVSVFFNYIACASDPLFS